MKTLKNKKTSRQHLEILEDRRLLSSAVISGDKLELIGNTNQSNAFLVRAAPSNRILGFSNNFGEIASLSTVKQVVIYVGNETDTVTVAAGVTTPVEVISPSGQVTRLNAGTSQAFNGSNTDSSDGNSSGSNSSSSSGSGSSSSGSGSSGSGSGSSSSGSGSSSSGSGSSGSGSGSSSSGSGSSGSSSGSSSSGSGSTGSGSGSSSSGSGSSSTGSGSTSPGSGSTSTGSGSSTTPSNPSNPATPDALITVTSSSTVLPQESVNVKALNSSFGDGTVLNSEITWNFGDPGSAYNTLVGFNAAHAYARPGTYTITLTITTPDGYTGIATQQITVEQDTRPTIYVSTDGKDSNNGLSASSPIQSLTRLNRLLTSDMRVLFQSGDTFMMNNTDFINAGGLHDVYIGSYGTGAQPILMYNGPAINGAMVEMSSTTQGLVVQGLEFNSIYSNNKYSEAIPSAFFPEGNDITILDNTFMNLLNDINMNGEPTNVLVQGNTSPSTTGLNAYFAWIQGNDIVILGNTVANSVGEAILRVGGANDILIANNNFTRLAAPGTGGKNCLSIQWGSYAYIYGNTLTTGPLSVGPIGVAGADTSASFNYAVIDSNKILGNSTILLQPGLDHVMAKNNLVVGQGNNEGFTLNGQEVGDGFNWQLQDVYIENNTVTEPGGSGGFLLLANGEAQGIHLNNNLFYAPKFSVGGDGAAFLTDANNDLNSFVEIKNNVWSLPASISSWTRGGYFFVGSNPSLQSGWLTPAEWEATGIATGDVYVNVDLGATYSVSVDGITAGSDLPTS